MESAKHNLEDHKMKKTSKKLVVTTIMISTAVLGTVGILGYETHKHITDTNERQIEIATQSLSKQHTKTIAVVPSGKKLPKKSAPPEIDTEDVSIREGESFNILDGVKAEDSSDNDLTKKIKTEGTVDVNTPGTYTVHLSVTDKKGKETTVERKVTVEGNSVNSSAALPSNDTHPDNSSTQSSESSDHNVASQVAPSSEVHAAQASQEPAVTSRMIEQTQPATPALLTSTMYVAGQAIPYQNGGTTYGQSIIDSNPDSMISTWGGAATQSGTDGQNTHFIGHNPGVFSVVFNLTTGNQIVVTDANGTPTAYTVSSIFQVDHYATGVADGVNYWDTITGTGGGERITLQACVNDTVNIIIIAYA